MRVYPPVEKDPSAVRLTSWTRLVFNTSFVAFGDLPGFGRVGDNRGAHRASERLAGKGRSMPGKYYDVDANQLVSEIKQGLPAAPGQMSEQEFSRLCENVANAIVKAIDMYDRRIKSPEPEYGEEERVV